MAGIEDALQAYKQKAIDRLVPGRSVGNRFLRNLNKSYDDKTDMFSGLGFRRFDLGKGETPIGAAGLGLAEGALNIPASLADVYKSIISPIDAGVSTIGEALFDPRLTETGRKKIAERIARDTSGMELGLPKSKIASEPVIGQSLETRDEVAKRLAEISNKADKANIGVDSFGADKSGDQVVSGEEEKADPKGQFSDPEADARIADMQQKIIENTQLGDMSQEGAEMEVITPEMKEPVLSEAEKKAQAQQTLFKEAMDDINKIYGKDSGTGKTRKTLAEYKKDFAEATGIDVSGEPDNKLALMSLGLSLMQNRAGKDFNLSNIIGAAGEAGQKALPLFEKAKAEARAGQVAAGKYALQETKADRAAALATAKEKRKALAALGKEFRDENSKRRLEYIKHKNNMEIELLKADMKPLDAKGKVTTQTLEGNNFLKVDTAFVTGSRNRVFLAPVQQSEKHANQYVNILEAKGSIREVQDILQELANQPNKPSAISILEGRVLSLLKPLGIGDTDYSQGLDKIIKEGTTPEQQVRAIQDRLISQYKKFLTKETGNGVSEGDIKRLKKLIGEIEVGQPLSENLNRLKQLDTIFDAPKRALESQFNSFSKRENYRNDDEYNKTMAIINKAISTGTDDLYSSSFKDGVFTIDLRKK
jgi:hypothetical protein